MKILVTGGAGFIGTNLIKKLLRKEYEVISIDNYSTGSKKNHIHGAHYVEHDLRDGIEMEGIDLVYHLASLARITPSFEKPFETIDSNFNSTLKVLEYCRENKIPMVYAGTSSHHSGRFKNPYTFSKDLCEDLIKLYQQHFELEATITRFYNVYGPHHLKSGSYCTLIGKWESRVENNLPLEIYGDGSKRRDFTHVDDIVDGLISILEKNAWGYNFEFGRGKNYSVKEISEMFGKEVVYKDNKIGEAEITLCEDKLALEILSWTPQKNIEDYISEYIRVT